MTREEATNILKAKLECYKCQTSETDFDCDKCDECSLVYEQGNMGEQKLALDMAIKALDQQPVRNVSVFSDNICEGISCDECSFNEIDDESGCLLQKRLDELTSFGELKSCKV